MLSLKGHGVIPVVKSRGRIILIVPQCRSNPGTGSLPLNSAPYGLAPDACAVVAVAVCNRSSCRAVGSVPGKTACARFRGILPSVSYAPFEGSAHPDVDNIPQIEKIRADLEKLSTMTRAIRPLLLDRRRRTGAAIVAEFGLNKSPSAPGSTRIPTATSRIRRGDQPRQAQQQRQRHRRRQRKRLPRRAEGRRPDRADQAGEEMGQRSRHHRRNLEHLARQPRTRLLRVDFIAAHVLPYWENFTDKQAADQATIPRPAPREIPHRHCRIALAERLVTICATPNRARSNRPWCCATSSPAPKRSACRIQHRRGDRSARKLAASDPSGVFSTPPANRNSPGPARS